MTSYKNILTGTVPLHNSWLISLNQINKENIIIFDFTDDTNIKQIIIQKKIHYILPLSEKDYLLIKNYINNSVIHNIKILYPDIETFNILHNKLLFTQFMLENFKEQIPSVYYLDNKYVSESEIEYPIISKPIYSTNGIGMKIYHNEDDFFKCKDKMIVQKFIDHLYEYSAYLLCIDGKIINWKIIKSEYKKYTIKTGTFPKNYQNVEKDELQIQIFEPIIVKLKYTGGMCIDFKYNTTTKKLDIFEINPRFGGSAFSNNFIYELLCIP